MEVLMKWATFLRKTDTAITQQNNPWLKFILSPHQLWKTDHQDQDQKPSSWHLSFPRAVPQLRQCSFTQLAHQLLGHSLSPDHLNLRENNISHAVLSLPTSWSASLAGQATAQQRRSPDSHSEATNLASQLLASKCHKIGERVNVRTLNPFHVRSWTSGSKICLE